MTLSSAELTQLPGDAIAVQALSIQGLPGPVRPAWADHVLRLLLWGPDEAVHTLVSLAPGPGARPLEIIDVPALEGPPPDPTPLLRLAREARERADTIQERRLLDLIVAHAPPSRVLPAPPWVRALLDLARMDADAGRWLDASAHLDQAAAHLNATLTGSPAPSPGDVRTLALRGEVALALAHWHRQQSHEQLRLDAATTALAFFERAVTSPPAPDESWNIEARRGQAVALREVGEAMLSLGDTVGATVQLDHCVARSRGLINQPPRMTTDACGMTLDLARALNSQGRAALSAGLISRARKIHDEAAQLLQLHLQARPDILDGRLLLAQVLLSLVSAPGIDGRRAARQLIHLSADTTERWPSHTPSIITLARILRAATVRTAGSIRRALAAEVVRLLTPLEDGETLGPAATSLKIARDALARPPVPPREHGWP